MPIGIRCRKGFDLRAAVRRHHNHRADYRDSIISEKRSGEDEPHGKVRAVEIFAMGRACLDAQIAGVRPDESIDDVVHAVLPGLHDRLKRKAIVERVEWLLQDVTERRRSEEHTSTLQSLMRISYAVFCLKKQKHNNRIKL